MKQPPELQTYLVLPDSHHPYVDKKAWALLLKVAAWLKPHGIVVLGDFCDFYSVSSHSKSPDRARRLAWEVDATNQALDQLDELGAKHKVFVEGNHEDRLLRYLKDAAPELFDLTDHEDKKLKTLSVEAIFGLAKRGWTHVRYKDDYRLGKLNITHDVGTAGRYSVYRCLDTYQKSNLTGHTHRFAYVVEGNARNEHKVSAQFGWLGDVEQVDYMHKATAKKNWALGFGIVYHDPKTGLGYVVPVPIVNYTCCVSGRLFR